jgi:hypothetical protein
MPAIAAATAQNPCLILTIGVRTLAQSWTVTEVLTVRHARGLAALPTVYSLS